MFACKFQCPLWFCYYNDRNYAKETRSDTQRTHFTHLLFTSCKLSHMRGMFSLDHNKNYIDEFVVTTKMKSRKQIYSCSRMLNVSPAPGSLIAGFLSYWWMWREQGVPIQVLPNFEIWFKNMGKYELVKF